MSEYLSRFRTLPGDDRPDEIRLRIGAKYLKRACGIEIVELMEDSSCPVRPRPAKVSKRPKTLRKSADAGAVPPPADQAEKQ